MIMEIFRDGEMVARVSSLQYWWIAARNVHIDRLSVATKKEVKNIHENPVTALLHMAVVEFNVARQHFLMKKWIRNVQKGYVVLTIIHQCGIYWIEIFTLKNIPQPKKSVIHPMDCHVRKIQQSNKFWGPCFTSTLFCKASILSKMINCKKLGV